MSKTRKRIIRECIKGFSALALVTALAACSSDPSDDGDGDNPNNPEAGNPDAPTDPNTNPMPDANDTPPSTDSVPEQPDPTEEEPEPTPPEGQPQPTPPDEQTEPVPPQEQPEPEPPTAGELDSDNARAFSINLLTAFDALVFFTTDVTMAVAADLDLEVDCPGGGSYSSSGDIDEFVTEFDDCALFRGESVVLNGELERPLQFAPGTAQGNFEFDNLEATIGNRTVEIDGDFSGQIVSDASSQIGLGDISIDDDGIVTTVEDGGLEVALDSNGSISGLSLATDMQFEQFSNTTYEVVVNSSVGGSVTCPNDDGGADANVVLVTDDDDDLVFTIIGGSGNNFTFEIGSGMETVNCSEVPSILSN